MLYSAPFCPDMALTANQGEAGLAVPCPQRSGNQAQHFE